MRKSESGPSSQRRGLHGFDRFGTPGGGGDPRELDQSIAFEPEESTIVRLSFFLELCFEVLGGVHQALHPNRPESIEPLAELGCPREKEGLGPGRHRPLKREAGRYRRRAR